MSQPSTTSNDTYLVIYSGRYESPDFEAYSNQAQAVHEARTTWADMVRKDENEITVLRITTAGTERIVEQILNLNDNDDSDDDADDAEDDSVEPTANPAEIVYAIRRSDVEEQVGRTVNAAEIDTLRTHLDHALDDAASDAIYAVCGDIETDEEADEDMAATGQGNA